MVKSIPDGGRRVTKFLTLAGIYHGTGAGGRTAAGRSHGPGHTLYTAGLAKVFELHSKCKGRPSEIDY